MDEKVNYTVVGFFVIVLSCALFYIIYWLSAAEHHRVYKTYLVYMNEAVSGLSEQAAVRFNGVRVGYVDKIKLNSKDPQQVRLKLRIEKETPITEATVATLKSKGVTGLRYLGLQAETAKAPPLQKRRGEKYPVIKSVPSLAVQLNTALRDLSMNMRNISSSLHQVFDKENAATIKRSLQNINQVSDVMAQHAKEIDASLVAMQIFLHNAAISSKQMPLIVKEARQTLTSINEMTQGVKGTLRDGRVAIQSVSQQTLPQVILLVNRLNHVAGHLEQLTTDLHRNPSLLLWGRKKLARGPGER